MTEISFTSTPHVFITADGISAYPFEGGYVVRLGSKQGYDLPVTKLFLEPDVARALIKSLHQAMVANGDAEPTADDDIDGVTVISDERLEELREQLRSEKRARGEVFALPDDVRLEVDSTTTFSDEALAELRARRATQGGER